MELASGSGRVTIPLARLDAASQLDSVGVEREGAMLDEAWRTRFGDYAMRLLRSVSPQLIVVRLKPS